MYRPIIQCRNFWVSLVFILTEYPCLLFFCSLNIERWRANDCCQMSIFAIFWKENVLGCKNWNCYHFRYSISLIIWRCFFLNICDKTEFFMGGTDSIFDKSQSMLFFCYLLNIHIQLPNVWQLQYVSNTFKIPIILQKIVYLLARCE